MKNKIKKLAVIGILAVSAVIMALNTNVPVKAQQGCPIVNYFNDFDIFVSNLIGYDNFTEYFKDIFSRNFCQRDDIFALETQLQKQSKMIRQAYVTCNTKGLTELENRAYELQLELMYLRKFVIDNPDKVEGAPIVVPYKLVDAELQKIFVDEKKIFDINTFNSVYSDIKKKYADRVEVYNNCVEPTWKELTEKWREFINTAAGLSPAWEKMKKSVEKKVKKINEAPPKRRGNFLEKWTELSINSLDPQRGLADIYTEFKEHSPNFTGPSYSDLLNTMDYEKVRYKADEEIANMLTTYKALYRDDIDESVKALTEKINKLNATLEQTFPIQKKLFKCAKTIQQKQCKNK